MRPPSNEGLADFEVDDTFKGIPLGERLALRDVKAKGWNIARGDMAFPVTTLRARAVENNVTTMATYCDRHGVKLAPHGKTSMAPQLFYRQLDAGAWAICAATPTQVATMSRYGIDRVFLANELVDLGALKWLGARLEHDETFDFYCLVDSAAGVRLMDEALDGVMNARRMNVFLELGTPGGRGGSRNEESAVETAEAVRDSRHLHLAGVETYEALATAGGVSEAELRAVDGLLDWTRSMVLLLVERGFLDPATAILSAGGSVNFDQVVEKFRSWPELEHAPVVVLRSGGYISHDAGRAHRLSPLDGRRSADEPLELVNALETWGSVLSTPESGLAIVGAGKRDLAYDTDPPHPLRVHKRDGSTVQLQESSVTKLMDQHAFVNVEAGVDVEPGDIMVFSISHPCAAFEKVRLLPLIDDEFNVEECVVTFF